MKTQTAALIAGLVVISAMTAVSAASDRNLHTAKKPSIQTGIDRLLKDYKQELKKGRADHQPDRCEQFIEKQR